MEIASGQPCWLTYQCKIQTPGEKPKTIITDRGILGIKHEGIEVSRKDDGFYKMIQQQKEINRKVEDEKERLKKKKKPAKGWASTMNNNQYTSASANVLRTDKMVFNLYGPAFTEAD